MPLVQLSLGSRSIPLISIVLSALIVVLFALAVLALRASPKAWPNRSLAAGALAVAVWVLGVCGLQTGTDLRLWLAVAFSGASFIPAALLQLVRHYPVTTSSPSSAMLVTGYLLATGFAACSVGTPLLFSRPRVAEGVLVRDSGPLYALFCAYFILSWALAIIVLTRKWRLATARQRTQLRYFGSGVMLSGAGGATTNLLIPYLTGISAYNWLGPCFVVPFIVFAAHSIVRHHLMDLRLVLHQKILGAFAALASLVPLLAVIGLALSRADRDTGLDWSAAALLVLAGLSIPFARDAWSALLDRYFYRARANYRQTMRESSALLTRGQTVRSLMEAMARHVIDATHPEGVAVYLGQDQSVSRSVVHATEESRFRAPEILPSVILDSLQGSAGGLLEQYPERARPSARSRSLRAALAELNWAVVLPLRSDDTVIGAIAVGPKLSGDPYYSHDVDLLATLANQVGIAVKNAQLDAEVVLANEYVENIVATINSGVVAINAAGRVTLFNRAAEHLTGLLAADVRLQSTSVLPACLGEPLVQTVADGRAVTYPEITLPGGAITRPVLCTVSPLHDAAGSVLGVVAVFSDLTPLKELEMERRRGRSSTTSSCWPPASPMRSRTRSSPSRRSSSSSPTAWATASGSRSSAASRTARSNASSDSSSDWPPWAGPASARRARWICASPCRKRWSWCSRSSPSDASQSTPGSASATRSSSAITMS